MIKKILFACCCFISLHSAAQDYKTGLGIRFGGLNSGITVKHFTSSTSAIEGIVSFSHRTFVITGLYEKHFPIKNAPGLTGFAGVGGHLGFFRYGGHYYIYKKRGNVYYSEDRNATTLIAGIDGILGLDYKIKGAPINLALDIKPFIDFADSPFGYFDGALSVRFTF